MYHKRKYKPLNPSKYNGDPTQIIMRSSWETRFAIWCDNNPSIVEWSSETTIIPYICPTDNRAHRYYVDFKIRVKHPDGTVKIYIVEIKPFAQTMPPKTPSRKTRRFLFEVMTWGKNDAKFKAARNYCKARGYEFMIITEKELGLV